MRKRVAAIQSCLRSMWCVGEIGARSAFIFGDGMAGELEEGATIHLHSSPTVFP